MYCMQMSRLEPWNTIETQLLIEYLCNMNHNKNIRPLQTEQASTREVIVFGCV